MLQQLALLKGFDLDRLDPAGPDFIHLQVECAKLAFADREAFYGDPDFVNVPIDDASLRRLQRRTPQAHRRHGFARIAARLDRGFRRGDQAPRRRRAGAARRRTGAGEPTVGRLGEARGDTVHFDIVDHAGNMVSATPSGGWLQSSPVIPELGFCLGTRAQMFWLDEGHPAALAPGKRPRTTLTPTLALRDGEPYLAWGSPGGDQQDQWITQFFLRHVHAGMNLQEAIDAPAWHSEHFPSRSGHARRGRACWSSKAACRAKPSPSSSAAATSSKSDRTGRKAASPPRRATANAAAPPPIRAACKAMRRAVELAVVLPSVRSG